MIYDAFLFYNELDILELRLNILEPWVDKFVIAEATQTFAGEPKRLFFAENRERFKAFEHKIIHHVIDDTDQKLWEQARISPHVGAGEHWWLREFYQKESILKAFTGSDLDGVFISDVDEIWNPKKIFTGANYDSNRLYKPILTAYHYYLNNRSDQNPYDWVGTRFGSNRLIRQIGLNHCKTNRELGYESIIIPDAGWHFTNIGNVEFIKTKLRASPAFSYGKDTSQLTEQAEMAMRQNVDFLGRNFKLWKDESDLPEYILQNRSALSHLLL